MPVNSGSGELTLLLDWSNPVEGAIYTVTALNGALAKPATSYQVGERALVQVYRENKLTREELVNLPFSPSDLESQSRLKWMGRKLECHGRMSFEEFCNLADLSEDRSYQRVLEKIYRRSNRLGALRVVSLGDLESLPGRIVDAEVKNVGKSRDGTPYGVFVEVLPGVDSLLHRTKMTQPLEEIANSKTVRVLVTDVNPQNRRVTVTQKGLV